MSLSDKRTLRCNLCYSDADILQQSVLRVEDVHEAIRELKEKINLQREAINELFAFGGERPDERLCAHLNIAINRFENTVDEIFGEQLT